MTGTGIVEVEHTWDGLCRTCQITVIRNDIYKVYCMIIGKKLLSLQPVVRTRGYYNFTLKKIQEKAPEWRLINQAIQLQFNFRESSWIIQDRFVPWIIDVRFHDWFRPCLNNWRSSPWLIQATPDLLIICSLIDSGYPWLIDISRPDWFRLPLNDWSL